MIDQFIKNLREKYIGEDSLDEKRGRKRHRKKAAKKKRKMIAAHALQSASMMLGPSAYASGAVVQCRRGKIWKGLKEDSTDQQLAENQEYEKGLESKIRKALQDEGGAAGMDALEKHTKASAEDIKAAVEDMSDVAKHKDGDYILGDDKKVQIVEETRDTYDSEVVDRNEANRQRAMKTMGMIREKYLDEETLEEKKKKKRRRKTSRLKKAEA